ncbi:MAG: hypothetical protein GW941_01230 [Candidatus Pacebacteria bacterium]|nr:hypothetical protein [Candidatus Paceibacterota bacterium]
MKEHAIPQDITGYKFHIVGNMTLKQFAEIAVGFVIAFFIFKTNLFAPIKYILVILSASTGAALAFLPIEERPLDHWFSTFFKVLYKPTKFYWKKKSKIPEAFTYQVNKDVKNQGEAIDLSPQRRQRISEYLQSVKSVQTTDEEELYNQQRSSQILSIFEDHSVKINYDRVKKIKQKPNLKVQVRSLIAVDENLGDKKENESALLEEIDQTNSVDNQEEIILEKQAYEYDPLKKNQASIDELATDIKIPELEKVVVDENYKDEKQSLGGDIYKNNKSGEEAVYVETTSQTDVDDNSDSVTINKDLPFPTKPSKPNKLVGMTLTQNNELINNATITLKDTNGNPVTAVRSNALGQFFITSQLNNGKYTIDIKKEGLSFYPVTITLIGETVDPLEIRSLE